jgi:hypothetical protein
MLWQGQNTTFYSCSTCMSKLISWYVMGGVVRYMPDRVYPPGTPIVWTCAQPCMDSLNWHHNRNFRSKCLLVYEMKGMHWLLQLETLEVAKCLRMHWLLYILWVWELAYGTKSTDCQCYYIIMKTMWKALIVNAVSACICTDCQCQLQLWKYVYGMKTTPWE